MRPFKTWNERGLLFKHTSTLLIFNAQIAWVSSNETCFNFPPAVFLFHYLPKVIVKMTIIIQFIYTESYSIKKAHNAMNTFHTK